MHTITQEEVFATKVIIAKQVILAMVEDYFWQTVLMGKQEEILRATERAVNRLEVTKVPHGEEEIADLIFKWTLPIRTEIAFEIGLFGGKR